LIGGTKEVFGQLWDYLFTGMLTGTSKWSPGSRVGLNDGVTAAIL
jgi:hypothetical protein